jgi:hypothetical protein
MQPAQKEESTGTVPADRDRHLGRFVLQSLLEAGQEQKSKHMKAYDGLSEQINAGNRKMKDPDLCRPFVEAREKARALANLGFHELERELEDIVRHVERVRRLWATAGNKEPSPQKRPPSKKGKASTSKAKDNPYSALAKDFSEGLAGIQYTTNVEEVKAACAYDCERMEQPERFAFCVAFKHLASIKAKAKGPSPMTIQFAESMAISGSYLKAMAAAQESAEQ